MVSTTDTQGASRDGQETVATTGRGNDQQQLDRLLLMIGQMNLAWTNTESLLIHLIAGLAAVPKDVATVIFLTLNTTRARLDLVSRLSKLDRVNDNAQSELHSIISAFMRLAKIRNKYNHCIYAFDDSSSNVDTIQLRIVDSKDSIRYGKRERVDASQLGRIRETISGIERLNLNIRRHIVAQGFPV